MTAWAKQALVPLAMLAFLVVLAACGGPEVDVIEGYVNGVNQGGDAIGLSSGPEVSEGEGYIVAGADWRDTSGAWHRGFPTCLEPLSQGQRVRLGVIDVPPEDD